MRVAILYDRKRNIIEFPSYTLEEAPLDQLSKTAIKCRKRGNNAAAEYLKCFSTFDIETTTVEQDQYSSPFGFMYHWQMCVGGIPVYGRTWKEFQNCLKKISDTFSLSFRRRMVIYVHNLSYEYQFMRSFIGAHDVFAVEERKVLKVTTESGFEFRCSYKLTNMSLEKACENEKGVEILKQSGDLDYRAIRTPSTSLSDAEFGYCIGDVVSLYQLIENRLKNESDNLESVPLTSTGYVRRDCRNSVRKDREYRKFFKSCAMTWDVYDLLKRTGRGGDTHANRNLSGKILHDAYSFDVQSSYPAMMCLKKYPMSRLTPYGKITSKAEFEELLETKACLFEVILVDVKAKPDAIMPYISYSKCEECVSPKLDNGRVLSASYINMVLTDIDYKLVREMYTWNEDTMYITKMHTADYSYLPESLLSVVRYYFDQKTVLKGQIAACADEGELEDLEYRYAKSKNRLNAIFGMCYTDPVRDVITIDEEGWHTEEANIQDQLDKYNNSRNSFLIYAWGIWVTAHARNHLNELRKAFGPGTAYSDTDSAKGCDPDFTAIENLNEQIKRECEERKAYSDYNEDRYYMGVYENETHKENYMEFITLGAKKYCYTDSKGLHLTISGVNKKKGAKELGDIRNFRPGFIFNESAGNALYYNDETVHTIVVNGETIQTASNIGMVDSTYEIGITAEYADVIDYDLTHVKKREKKRRN